MICETINDAATMRGETGSTLGRIDQYELLRELGGGGFGSVYLARDAVSGVEVAVKGLPPFVKNSREEMENIRSNFALVSRLHHPNIAAALVLHPAAHVAYASADVRGKLRVGPGDTLMVLEYAPGVTLSQWSRQFPGKRVPVSQAVGIVRQIASALDYAHERKIVHRDIKPANVMVETAEGGAVTARVLDFGLAAELRSSMGRVSREIHDTSGTRPYMAPEQWLGGRQGAATDQYALAVLFNELVTGEVPFASAFETGDPVVMMNVVGREPVVLQQDLPKPVRQALAKALAKGPEDRFASCMEFCGALEGTVKVSRGGSEPRRVWVWILVAALAAAAVAVGACFAWTRHHGDTRRARRRTASAEKANRLESFAEKGAEKRPVASAEAGEADEAVAPAEGRGNGAAGRDAAATSGNAVAGAAEKGSQLGQGAAEIREKPAPVPYLETHEEKGRRAYELYRRGEGRKILETFSDYDAEMVPEIAYLKGVVYRDGLSGVKKDLPKTAQMFTLAANRGHAQAQLDLAVMYAEGIGVSRDLGKFLHWTEKAAEQGVVDAALNIGYLYFSGGAGGRVKVDYGKALKYLKIAADGGRFSACAYLGAMYQKGFGVDVDNMEALKWFKLGAENGDALSENNLGYMYLKGFGTVKDTAKAVECFQKADAHGNKGAAMSLGLMYENGDGVPQDLHEARRLYLRAKEHGVDGAEKALQRVDGKLKGNAVRGRRFRSSRSPRP